jgi:hypothetical protein
VSSVVILGAGPIGGSVAHRLAERGRVESVVLVDASETVAAGKALDIRQSGPISHVDTAVSASAAPLAAASGSVVVVADEVDGGEWEGERGLAMVRGLVRAGVTAPLVFAGTRQLWLAETGYRELKVPAHRLVATAPSAMAGALRAWTGLEMGLSDAQVVAVGRPPHLVVGWSAAMAGGILVTDRVPPHRLLALSARLAQLWPPGPLSIASATAPVVEALIFGSRQLHLAATVIDGELGARGRAVMLPLDLAPGRVRSHVMPSLSPQERTELLNAIAD